MTESAEQVYKRALSEMKKEQWLAAIKLLEREVAVVQKNWRFSWNLGWCYFKLAKFDSARKHMIRAALLAPDNPTCKWGLGNVYLKKKHFKKAEVVLTESLGIKESHLTSKSRTQLASPWHWRSFRKARSLRPRAFISKG